MRFADELDPARTPLRTTNLAMHVTETGYTPNLASVGPALAWTPFFLFGHAHYTGRERRWIGWIPDGYAPPYIVMVTLASALMGLVSMIGCFRITRRWFPEPQLAALTAITIFLGSNLLYYAQFEGSFAHSQSAATATMFVLASIYLSEKPTLRRWSITRTGDRRMIVTTGSPHFCSSCHSC